MTEADKPAFLQALARLAVALREPEPDVVQLRVFFEAMKDLDVELIAMAATQLAKESAWFPKTSEWRAMAAKIERKRTEELRALQRKLPEPLCLACEDTGWTRSDNRVHRYELRAAAAARDSRPAPVAGVSRGAFRWRTEETTRSRRKKRVR